MLVGRGAFTLPKVTVGVEDTVLWLWSGPDTRHSITADPGRAESFDSDPGHDARRGRGRPPAVAVRPARVRLVFTSTERATVLARVERRSRGRWRPARDFDLRARRGRNEARMPLRGIEAGRYRVRLTAYDAADNRSRTVTRRFRLG